MPRIDALSRHAAPVRIMRVTSRARLRYWLGHGGRTRRWLGGCALVIGAACLQNGAPAQAQGNPASASLERSVKAAFLYKFLGYTEFPPSAFADAAAPVAIGVMGADDLAAELSRVVSGRNMQGRSIVVQTLREGDTPGALHLLFIGGSDTARVRAVLKGLPNAPMLLVTESDNALQYGSIINFRIVDARVRFDVSLDAADKNGIKLSSRLLTVANHVQKGAP